MMDFLRQNLATVLVVVGVVAFMVWRQARFAGLRRQLPTLLSQGAILIDVRSKGEFAAGHNPSSRNIPLDELARHLSKLDRTRPVIVCCASGTRSGMALGMLKSAGFAHVLNAGPWQNTVGA